MSQGFTFMIYSLFKLNDLSHKYFNYYVLTTFLVVFCSQIDQKMLITAIKDKTWESEHRKTKGPKGPCVAHLRKRSKVTVEPFTEDH